VLHAARRKDLDRPQGTVATFKLRCYGSNQSSRWCDHRSHGLCCSWSRWWQATSRRGATVEGNAEVIEYLVSQGARLEFKNGSAWTALEVAVYEGHLNNVRTPLRLVASMEAPGECAQT
jgi:hypothetical protein